MIQLLIGLSPLLAFWAGAELSLLCVYGLPYTQDVCLDGFTKSPYKPPYAREMICNWDVPDCCYIATTPWRVLSKYYVQAHGVVPRFSKLHKKIENKFKELENQPA